MELSLKRMANKAKDRLLNKGLRDFYCNGAVAVAGFNNNMNFYNKHKKDDDAQMEFSVTMPSRDDKLVQLSKEGRERYILECVRKYQEEKRRALQKELLGK